MMGTPHWIAFQVLAGFADNMEPDLNQLGLNAD